MPTITHCEPCCDHAKLADMDTTEIPEAHIVPNSRITVDPDVLFIPIDTLKTSTNRDAFL